MRKNSFEEERRFLIFRSHAKPSAFNRGGFVRQLLTLSLRVVVVRLRETTGNVAFRRGFHVQDDQEGHRDQDEQRDGDDAQNVHVRQGDVRDGLVGRERRGGKRRRRRRDRLGQLFGFLGDNLLLLLRHLRHRLFFFVVIKEKVSFGRLLIIDESPKKQKKKTIP